MPRKLKIKGLSKPRRSPRPRKALDPSHVHPEPVKKEKRLIWPRAEPKGWRWLLLSHTSPSGKMMHACNLCGYVTATPDKWEYHGVRCDETCNPMVKTVRHFEASTNILIVGSFLKDPIIFRSEAQLEGIKKDAETAARRKLIASIHVTAKYLENGKKRLPTHLKKDHARLRHHISALYLLWSDLMRQEDAFEQSLYARGQVRKVDETEDEKTRRLQMSMREETTNGTQESPPPFRKVDTEKMQREINQDILETFFPRATPSRGRNIDPSRFDDAQMEFQPHR